MTDAEFDQWLTASGFSGPDDILPHAITPLMHAARHGRAEVVAALLARGGNPSTLNADGNGALWYACYADCGTCVDLLVRAGVDLDTRNVNGATALIYAASAGKAERVRQLLAAGADASIRTLDDYSALDSCATRECLKLLRAA